MLKHFLIHICAMMLLVAAYAEQPQAPAASEQPEQPFPVLQPATPPTMFQPMAIDPELVRQSMQARSEADRLNRAITARRNELFESNDELKALQAEMRELQQKIDGVLENDSVLQELKAKQQEIAPDLPAGVHPFPMATTPKDAVTPENK